jgi:hypothetical protein
VDLNFVPARPRSQRRIASRLVLARGALEVQDLLIGQHELDADLLPRFEAGPARQHQDALAQMVAVLHQKVVVGLEGDLEDRRFGARRHQLRGILGSSTAPANHYRVPRSPPALAVAAADLERSAFAGK